MRLWLLLSIIPGCISLNILIFLIGTNQFERNNLEFLAQQLALRNHQVVSVKPILIPEEPVLVKPKLHLVREKTIKNMIDRNLYEPLKNVGKTVWSSKYEQDKYDEPYWKAHNASCYKILNSNLMDQLRKDNMDVAIVYSGNPCLLAITHILAIPTIYYDTQGLTDETLVAAGAPLELNIPSSHCKLPEVPKPFDRIRNGVCVIAETLVQSGVGSVSWLISQRYRNLDGPITRMFAQDYSIKKKFKKFPDVNQLKRQSSLFFVNSDPLLEFPRSLPSHVVSVAGIAIDKPKPLFAPWNTTIAAAEEGMIVVSMGTQADSSAMTENQARAFLDALSSLKKYRIYWRVGPNMKLPGIEESHIPAHINLTSFIPQNDLLAHKSCKLLVTNGGMNSIMEALHGGVPIVGIPLYGSNRHNLKKVVSKGLGLIVEKEKLTAAALLMTMKSVLSQSNKYSTVASEMSRELKGRLSGPFETALHYIEHVGRHHGAPFFSPEREHPLSRLPLDFFLLIILYLVLLPLYILYRLLRLCFRGKTSNSVNNVKEESKKRQESKKEK